MPIRCPHSSTTCANCYIKEQGLRIDRLEEKLDKRQMEMQRLQDQIFYERTSRWLDGQRLYERTETANTLYGKWQTAQAVLDSFRQLISGFDLTPIRMASMIQHGDCGALISFVNIVRHVLGMP